MSLQCFSNSACFDICARYCKSICQDVHPLSLLFWMDDFLANPYAQSQPQTKGGVSFRVLNFPQKFQERLKSVFFYSVKEPKSQDIMMDIVQEMNMLYDGIKIGNLKLVPMLNIFLGDNPERYKITKRNHFRCSIQNCTVCKIDKKDLPFSKPKGFNEDKEYLSKLNGFIPIFLKYREIVVQFLKNKNPNVNELLSFQEENNKIVKRHRIYGYKSGFKFLKFQEFELGLSKTIRNVLSVRKGAPNGFWDIDICPFVYLYQFWKGLFPIFTSVAMEPFHTVFNLLKAHLGFLNKYSEIDVLEFQSFIKKMNLNKDLRIKYSQDFKKWHGDQYLSLLKFIDVMQEFCKCLTPKWQKLTQRYFILLSILKNGTQKFIKEHKILEKVEELRIFFSAQYVEYVKKKITQHQLYHLVQNYEFLGHPKNYDGQLHEKKHKLWGAVRLFVGGDTSRMMWAHETRKENICLAKEPFLPNTPSFKFVEEDWFKLESDWNWELVCPSQIPPIL